MMTRRQALDWATVALSRDVAQCDLYEDRQYYRDLRRACWSDDLTGDQMNVVRGSLRRAVKGEADAPTVGYLQDALDALGAHESPLTRYMETDS